MGLYHIFRFIWKVKVPIFICWSCWAVNGWDDGKVRGMCWCYRNVSKECPCPWVSVIYIYSFWKSKRLKCLGTGSFIGTWSSITLADKNCSEVTKFSVKIRMVV